MKLTPMTLCGGVLTVGTVGLNFAAWSGASKSDASIETSLLSFKTLAAPVACARRYQSQVAPPQPCART